VCDGGLVLDMSSMKRISVDPERDLVVAEAWLTLGEFDAATSRCGLRRRAPIAVLSQGLALAGYLGAGAAGPRGCVRMAGARPASPPRAGDPSPPAQRRSPARHVSIARSPDHHITLERRHRPVKPEPFAARQPRPHRPPGVVAFDSRSLTRINPSNRPRQSQVDSRDDDPN
jgi:hypothetical protein